jgi:periplasmic mercuric ion binding protein
MRLETDKRRWIIGFVAAALTALVAVAGSRLSHTCCLASASPVPGAASASEVVRSTVLRIDGMTCASCSVTVRLALKRLTGVRDAKVDAQAKTAVVEYDPTKVTPGQMIEAVNRAGYQGGLAAGSGA